MKAYEWQKRLADTFHTGGIVGAELLPIMDAETAFGVAVETRFQGFATLNAAFQAFLLETLVTSDTVAQQVRFTTPHRWYRPVLLSFVGVFHLFRAADRLFRTGHPLNGYGLIRDVKDRTFAYSAILSGLATFEQVNGWDAAKVEPPETFTAEHAQAMVKARKKIDALILSSMIGKTSGFTDGERKQLFRWNDMFHTEVHGGRLTFALEGGRWLEGKGPLPLVPDASEKEGSVAMFVNRFEETAWLTLRCLCYLQSADYPFSERWRARWQILDDSLRIVHEEAVRSGRAVAAEFLRLVDTKFAYSPAQTFYIEPPAESPAT